MVGSRLLDQESADFADDLSAALAEGHWSNVSRIKSWVATDKRGVFVATVAGTSSPETGELIAALKHAGIDAEPLTLSGDDVHMLSPWFEAGVVYLLVGVKP